MTKGKKNEILSNMDYKVNAIANAIQLVKAWIESKVIDRIKNNENGKIISSNINKATS